jgi:hypothetical protein
MTIKGLAIPKAVVLRQSEHSCHPCSGAAGSSDTEVKAAKGSGERVGTRASFNSVVGSGLPRIRAHSCPFVVLNC